MSESEQIVPHHQREFADFAKPIIGLPVSHVWRGAGSALFLEFGELRPRRRPDGSVRLRPNGSPGNPHGECGLMIAWSWRIEGNRSILCGSWSDEQRWPRSFGLLKGATVAEINLFGRLPEIEITLSNRVRLLSFMTSDGDPEWSLFDRRGAQVRWISVVRGQLNLRSEDRP